MEKYLMISLKQTAKKETDKLTIFNYMQKDMQIHQHDCFELAYVINGSALQTLNGTTLPVKKSSYFIIDHGTTHNYMQCKNLELINCLFVADLLDASLKNCTSFNELMRICMIRFYKQYLGYTPVNHVFNDEDGRVLRILKEIMEEHDNRSIGYRELFRGKLMEILILTMRKVVKEQGKVPIKQLTDNIIIQAAVGYFETNYQDKALLTNFCKEYHYNQQYISRRFKKETGLTVLEYIQKIRIKKSCNLLIGSNLSIQEIAFNVGYEDVKYFNTIFRRTIGMTPGEYRKTAQMLH